MVIDSMFLYQIVDPDLRVKIFFNKSGQQKMILKQGIGFEIGDIGASAHLYWRLKKIFIFIKIFIIFIVFLLFFW